MSKRLSKVTQTLRNPENVESVRQAVLRSPSRSARKHSSEPFLSNHSKVVDEEGAGIRSGVLYIPERVLVAYFYNFSFGIGNLRVCDSIPTKDSPCTRFGVHKYDMIEHDGVQKFRVGCPLRHRHNFLSTV
ncbi:hypothetical protein AVEN_53393-1 [Araneus ventricosus]|uniref:Uncharacterized protein n=1 Tax=Araneus ventricosus TaxID=182803 RepID=A0A4Y2AA46_ARAVE|nr:hypothetical protein AVEN_53393-1 [Araneus ventricosus]